MDSVQQMVYLALRTAKNSTLVQNFGLRSFGDVVTDSTKKISLMLLMKHCVI